MPKKGFPDTHAHVNRRGEDAQKKISTHTLTRKQKRGESLKKEFKTHTHTFTEEGRMHIKRITNTAARVH